jgi:hypothetical protein
MVRCPKCGMEIRYITASAGVRDNGIMPVEVRQEELITETGRKVRGYRAHRCGGNNAVQGGGAQAEGSA